MKLLTLAITFCLFTMTALADPPKVFDVAKAKKFKIFKLSGGDSRFIFKPSGKGLISGGRSLKYWSKIGGKPARTVSNKNFTGIISLAMTSNGKILAVGHSSKKVSLWKHRTSKPYRQFYGHTKDVKNVAISKDDKSVFSLSQNEMYQWDIKTGELIKKFEKDKYTFSSLSLSGDGKTLAIGTKGRTAIIWDVENQKQIQEVSVGSSTYFVKLTPNGKRLISTTPWAKGVDVWNIKTGKKELHYGEHGNYSVVSACISPDGKTVVSSGGNAIHAWDIETGKLHWKQDVKRNGGSASYLTFSKDGRMIAFHISFNSGIYVVKLD